jgi:hypothetical protein
MSGMEEKMTELTDDEKFYGKWFIMHKKINNFDPKNIDLNNMKYIHAPSGHFYADPIATKHNGLYYVFFETFDYKKGELAYYTLDENLNQSEIKKIDIDIGPHTSFPYIIQDNEKYYMIPETCHLDRIGLYECISFPDKWRFKKTLVDKVHAGDNSVIWHNNMYYMFTVIYKNNRNHFCIYYSESLMGEWKPHKLVNMDTAIGNEHTTRCAGKIIQKDGRIFRPAQFSDRGINGEAVTLYEILTLSPTEYHSVPVNIISKSMLNTFRATHTFSLCDDLISMDGRLERTEDHPFTKTHINLEEEIKKMQDNNYYVDHEKLEQISKCNTSGNGACYYEITAHGKTYPGERKWEDRWNLIKDCMNFDGKKILEIGCNMGMVMTYAKKFRNAGVCLGVDQPDQMLIDSNKKDTLKAAKLLDEAFLLKDISYLQMDLNKERYEEIIGTDYDVAVAMSILKWIDDQDRFLTYLSKFKYVLYEGHDSDDIEIERFAKHGFQAQVLGSTQIGASYPADQKRTLILFTK